MQCSIVLGGALAIDRLGRPADGSVGEYEVSWIVIGVSAISLRYVVIGLVHSTTGCRFHKNNTSSSRGKLSSSTSDTPPGQQKASKREPSTSPFAIGGRGSGAAVPVGDIGASRDESDAAVTVLPAGTAVSAFPFLPLAWHRERSLHPPPLPRGSVLGAAVVLYVRSTYSNDAGKVDDRAAAGTLEVGVSL